jgi:hypothetical protein
MPQSSAKRLFVPSGLPSSEIEIDSDILSEFGIKRGSTVDYIPYNDRYTNFIYQFKVEGIDAEFYSDKSVIAFGAWIEGRHYTFPDLDILAVIVVKPKLRLVK